MTTFAVTVTYGNRFHLLRQVVDRALEEGVAKVIVVDNNSVEESKNRLKEYEERLQGKIKVLYLDDNYGSAGGFKRGLEEAYKDNECEYIWLLDDDNVPQKDSLISLSNCFNNLKISYDKIDIALVSYRFKKEFEQIEAVLKNNPNIVLGGSFNAFYGFNILLLFIKIFRYIKRKIENKDYNSKSYYYNDIIRNYNFEYGKVSVAPYGGMFFNKNTIKKIGYPKEELFVYADDHEWSYRITKSGGVIFVCFSSLLDDIDMSWNVKENKHSIFDLLLEGGDDLRVYYAVRNRIFFEINYLVNKKIIYYINKNAFLFLLWGFSFFKNKKRRFNLIKKAIHDAMNKKLGRIML